MNSNKYIKRLLHKEDFFPVNHLPSTFTEAESNLTMFIILAVIVMLIWIPIAEFIR